MSANWKIPLSFVISLNHSSSVLLKAGLYSYKSRLLWKLVDSVLVSSYCGWHGGLNDYFSICNLFIWEVKCQVHTGWKKLLFINMQTNTNICCQSVQKDQTRDKKYLNSNCQALPHGLFNRWKEIMKDKTKPNQMCCWQMFIGNTKWRDSFYPPGQPDHYEHQHYKQRRESASNSGLEFSGILPGVFSITWKFIIFSLMLTGLFASVKHNWESSDGLMMWLHWESANPAGMEPHVPSLAVYKAGMVVDTCNSSNWEVEAEG